MFILGLGGSNHDFSSCIVKNGQVLSMVEEERLSRKKHGIGMGIELAAGNSIKENFRINDIGFSDIDLIIGNEILNEVMYKRITGDVVLINHHLAHAASSYYPSPFDEAAVLVADAVGSSHMEQGTVLYDSISYAIGRGADIEIFKGVSGRNLNETDYIENSLGIFYSIITQIIGFEEHQEGKTMGLAPYGSDRFYHLLKQHVRYKGEGNIEITKDDIQQLFSYKTIIDKENSFSIRADFAYGAQKVLEEILMELCYYIKKETGLKNLCLAGGIALNSVANYKIYQSKIFDNMFIQPAAGDNGTSIGSALYGYYSIKENKRHAGI